MCNKSKILEYQVENLGLSTRNSEYRVENLGLSTRNSEYRSINLYSLAKCRQMCPTLKILEYRVEKLGIPSWKSWIIEEKLVIYRLINWVSLKNTSFSTYVPTWSFSIQNLGKSAIFLESPLIGHRCLILYFWSSACWGGYSVQNILQECAADIHRKFSLLVCEWTLTKCKLWYMIGLFFHNFESKSAQI